MPTVGTKEKKFDWPLFVKTIALQDSPEEAEAAAAAFRMRSMLKKEGRKLYDALEAREYKVHIWEAYQPEPLKAYFDKERANDAEMLRLRNQVGKLDAALRETQGLVATAERESAVLARGFTEERQTSDTLRGELRRQEEIWRGRIAQVETAARLSDIQRNADRRKSCLGCESKRRVLSVIAAWPVQRAWFTLFPWDGAHGLRNLCGLLAAASPLLWISCCGYTRHFREKWSWVSVRDNDLYRMGTRYVRNVFVRLQRRLANAWNRFLRRMLITDLR
jgi:hypothetical protein